MIVQLFTPEFREFIASHNWQAIKEIIKDIPAVDLAEVLGELDDDTALIIFRLLKKEKASGVFSYLSSAKGIALLDKFSSQQVKDIFGDIAPDDRVAILEELPGHLVQRVMNSLDPKDLMEAKKILGYPENSVGRLMTPKYVRVKSEWTIERSLEHIRKWGRKAETINVIYVVDEEEKLIDDLKLEQLLLSSIDEYVSTIMDNSFVALRVDDDQEEAVKMLAKYDRVALPVVDLDGILVGIITADDVFDVAVEETTEDMQLMAGMEALDNSYSETSISDMIKKRIGWLLILFVGQILTATALSFFENIIASAVFLSLFIPMILSSGGNSGSQAATLIIRALSTDDIHRREWITVLKREIISGLILGALLGSSGFLVITFWAHYNGMELNTIWWLSAMAVSFSLVCVVLFGNLLGSMMPFLLSRLGLDPAVTSGPFVSTISDVTGILIYFSIAVTLLKGIIF